jgi:cytochrome c oxidase subunit 2
MRAKKALSAFLLLLVARTAVAQEQGFKWSPPQASANAPQMDLLFNILLLLSTIIAGGVCLLIVAFCIKYRRGKQADRTNPPNRNLPLELTWFFTPIVLSIGAFGWGAWLFYLAYQPPKNALTVYVVGKQWMWKIEHPNGRCEIDALHIPIGRPIKLQMTSEDVIHDFYIPAFRVKQDVLPGRYTEEWFTATRPGKYHLFCAQYCGTDHSKMGGWVYAMTPADYAKWIDTGSPDTGMSTVGENLFHQYGCTGCHGPASNVHAPSLVGIYNHLVPLDGKKFVTADDRYLHDSIVYPAAQIAAGYPNAMPAYQKVLSEEQILQIVAYIRSLGDKPMDDLQPPVQNPATLNGRGTGISTETDRALRQASGGGAVRQAHAGANASDTARLNQLRADVKQRMQQKGVHP